VKPNLRKTWTKVWNAIGRGWHGAASWLRRQRWLRQPLHHLGRIPALLRPIGRQLRRIPDAMRHLLRPLGRVGGALLRVPALLWTIPQLLRRLGTQTKNGLLAIGRLPSSARFCGLVAGLLTVPLGGYLMVAPVRVLARLADIRALDLNSLLTATGLLAGVATLTAGLGMLFCAPSFRRMLWLSLLCSLALAGAFGYRAETLMQGMQGAGAAAHRTPDPEVDGGIQQMLLSLGLSAYLGALLWLRPLRRLPCNTPLLRGRAGILLAPCYGGAFGMGVGYSLWLGLLHFAERDDMQFLRRVLGFVRVEHLAYGCGTLGALWFLRRWWRRRDTTGKALRQGQNAALPTTRGSIAAAPTRTATAAQPRPAQPGPAQPAPAKPQTPVRQPQLTGSIPSRP
jgi:hypothetical protein